MQYITLDDYRYTWFFKHRELPVNEQTLRQIKPLAETFSNQIWHQMISNNANHPDLFHKEDWPMKQNSWKIHGKWQGNWESQKSDLPDEVADFIDWEGNTVVYFCYHADNIIETTWEVFCTHWKNFLFLDNGPILIGKRRKEVIQFHEDGRFSLGEK